MLLAAASCRLLPPVPPGLALTLTLVLTLTLFSLPRRIPLPLPFLALVAHAGSSMAMRSAAIPREPYAFTEPSDMPSVSATWASVMSAK